MDKKENLVPLNQLSQVAYSLVDITNSDLADFQRSILDLQQKLNVHPPFRLDTCPKDIPSKGIKKGDYELLHDIQNMALPTLQCDYLATGSCDDVEAIQIDLKGHKLVGPTNVDLVVISGELEADPVEGLLWTEKKENPEWTKYYDEVAKYKKAIAKYLEQTKIYKETQDPNDFPSPPLHALPPVPVAPSGPKEIARRVRNMLIRWYLKGGVSVPGVGGGFGGTFKLAEQEATVYTIWCE